MKSSSNPVRRIGLTLLTLGLAAAGMGFTFTFNDSTRLPIKWPAKPITIRIMLGGTTTLSDGLTFNESARAAAQTWNTVIGSAQIQSTFATGTPAEQTNNDQTPVNELGFSSTVFGRPFDSGVLAVTTGFSAGNERTEADILFNSAVTWNSYRGPTQSQLGVDLQRVAIHELGHLLGLNHPDQANPPQFVTAIMRSTVGSLDTVASDDIDGAQSLYGPPGTPANDSFSNATVLNLSGSQSLSAKGYNTNATKESGEPTQGDNPGGHSVWWAWTAPSSGNVTLDTGKTTGTGQNQRINVAGGSSSYFDTTLGVYTGASVNGLTKVGENDDINPGVVQASRLTFAAAGGTTYHICVDGYNADDGNGADNGGIVLNLAFDGSLGTAPAITTQPSSLTVTSGSSASFSVAASGSSPLSYQWSFGGTAISGATSSTFNITSATSANAGTYTVTVSNAAGSVTSNAATLSVTAAPTPPTPSTGGGGGGGGGGAPSVWFTALLAAIGFARLLGRRRG
ncbi:MAG TPA: matrixin family metalloprotease [Lacunisphaera sp.]|nr:matrixin family metalloprotease [Lacunisphaera sp.]